MAVDAGERQRCEGGQEGDENGGAQDHAGVEATGVPWELIVVQERPDVALQTLTEAVVYRISGDLGEARQ
jgi:hypothetical protein